MLDDSNSDHDGGFRKRRGGAIAAVVMAVPLIAGLCLAAQGSEPAPASETPVVLELFTSQGCSSCPPADQLLSRLVADGAEGGQAVIALSFHVDYWNYIGWTDPFSSAQWSDRQSFYARGFGSGRVYTPQLVINGTAECVGSSERKVRDEIARAAGKPAAGRLALELAPGTDPRRLDLEISARVLGPASGRRWTVMVAVFEKDLVTPVAKGENGGRTLRNSHVVRSLTEAFSLPAEAGAEHTGRIEIEIGDGWKRDDLGIVAFLQDPETRQIHGATVRPGIR